MKTTSKQKAFDIVWDHFIVKKSPPGTAPNNSHCEYRTKDGHMCAVGILLTAPELKDIEGSGYMRTEVSTLVSEGILRGVSDTFSMFLDELQNHHDRAAQQRMRPFHTEVEARLRKLSAAWDLRIP